MTELIVEVDENPRTPIRPHSIRLSVAGTVMGSFNKYEVELTAGHLIEFFRSENRWCPFTLTQLAEFYKFKGWNPNTMLFGLTGVWFDDGAMGSLKESPPYLCFMQSGDICVTQEFITRCAQSAGVNA